MKLSFENGNALKRLKLLLQTTKLNPFVAFHFNFNLDVSYVVLDDHVVCCCYDSKCLEVDQNCISFFKLLG